MKLRISMAVLALFVAAPFAFAQTVKVGNDAGSVNGGDLAASDIRTDISLDGATASGAITSVTVYWSNSNCTNAFTIKSFRRNGDLLTPTGERGPFTTTSNVMTIDLQPALQLSQGDLIGIARVGNCGNVGTVSGASTAGYLSYYGNVTTNTTIIDGQRESAALAVVGTGPATDSIVAVLPAVGSVRGLFGSSFRTSVQLLNPTTSPMKGWLLFTPHGTTSGGYGYPYTIPAGEQISIDLAEAFTGSSSTPIGLGTLDIEVFSGYGKPQIVARVYNDAGTAGTAGFYEDPVMLSDTGDGGHVITKGATAFMVSPVDPKRTRFSIGVRALFAGAELTAELLDNAGHVLASTTQRYPAGYFEQVDAASFFGGVPVGPSKTIRITVTDGSAVVYGATTDNVTNDPSVQYALVAQQAQ